MATLKDKKYSALKVSTSLPKFPTVTDRELKIYKHLTNINSANPSQSLIRQLYGSFHIQGPVVVDIWNLVGLVRTALV